MQDIHPTGYFANIFTKAGFPVGHERFGKDSVGISDWLMSSPNNHRHSPLKFDHIFLLVRHPLKVVHSEYGTQWDFKHTSSSGITADVARETLLWALTNSISLSLNSRPWNGGCCIRYRERRLLNAMFEMKTYRQNYSSICV